jgi:hypothetical protein
MAEAKKTLLIEYYRSKIATPEKHKKVVKGLGFTRRRSAAWSRRFPTWCVSSNSACASSSWRVVRDNRIIMRVGLL